MDLSETTDVSLRPEFAGRRRNITFPSEVAVRDPDTGAAPLVSVEGFFSFDFTLAEIKTLRAKQRLTQRSSTYNGLFQVPTLEEVVDMVREAEGATGRKVGIYAELKEPYFFHLNGFDIESKVVEVLQTKDMGVLSSLPHLVPGPDVPAPLVLQCFDPYTLRRLAQRIPHVPLVQLLLSPLSKEHSSVGQGVSHHLGREATFGDMTLPEIAAYASGIGPAKSVFTSMDPAVARAVVDEAHELDLAVHPWTFRREAMYVDTPFQADSDEELRFFFESLNVDALFVEFPDQASMVIEKMLSDDSEAGLEDVSPEIAQAASAAARSSTLSTAPLPSRRGRSSRSNRSSSSSHAKTGREAPAFSVTNGKKSAPKDVMAEIDTMWSSALSALRSLAGSVVGGKDGSSWMEGGVCGGEGDADTSSCQPGACSVDGVADAVYRLPYLAVPWFRRKAT